MVQFSPEAILVSCSGYALVMLASMLKYYISNRRKNDVSALIIPWGSGTSTLVKQFQEEYHASSIYMLDLEDLVFKDDSVSSDMKNQLNILKAGNDPVMYESQLMIACNIVLIKVLGALKTDRNRKIIVCVSSVNIANYLGLKKQTSLTPQGKLQKEILNKEACNPFLISYCRSQLDMKKKNSLIYTCFDDMLTIVEEKYKISNESKKNLK